MKKLLSLLALALICFTFGMGQAAGNGNGNNGNGNGGNNGNGNGNGGNGNSGNGTTFNLCGVELTPGAVLNECFNGNGLGNCPYKMSLVNEILKAAQTQYPVLFPQSLGTLKQYYHACSCVITYLGGGLFRVQSNTQGVGVVVLIDLL